MEILRIYLDEHFLIKYCVIKFFLLLKVQTLRGFKEVLLQWLIIFLIKSFGAVARAWLQTSLLATLATQDKQDNSAIENNFTIEQ